MIYSMTTIRVPRSKINEVLDVWGNGIREFDIKNLAKVGGKFIGCWTTDIGNKGEITFMFAFPNYAAREKGTVISVPKKVREALKKYVELTPNASSKTMKPVSFSPLQ